VVSGCGLRVPGFGSTFQGDLWFRVSCFVFRGSKLPEKAEGLEACAALEDHRLGLPEHPVPSVQGSGFGIPGSVFRVSCSVFRISG